MYVEDVDFLLLNECCKLANLCPGGKHSTRHKFAALFINSDRNFSHVHQTNARLPVLISHGAEFVSHRSILLHQGEDRVVEASFIERPSESVQAIFIPA